MEANLFNRNGGRGQGELFELRRDYNLLVKRIREL